MFINDILQPTHLLFILVVALLVLGPKRLPEAGRALGKGLRDFRTAISGDEDRASVVTTEAPPPVQAPLPVHAPFPTEAPASNGAVAQPVEAAADSAETVHPVG